MSETRERILARLRANRPQAGAAPAVAYCAAARAARGAVLVMSEFSVRKLVSPIRFCFGSE